MEILLELTSNKLLVGDMWNLAKDQACDNWIETMGRFILESTLVQEWNWRILLEKPFDVQTFFSLARRMCIHFKFKMYIWLKNSFRKTVRCANLFFSLARRMCTHSLIQKVFWLKIDLSHKTFVVLQNSFFKQYAIVFQIIFHQSVNLNSLVHSLRVVFFETFRFENS